MTARTPEETSHFFPNGYRKLDTRALARPRTRSESANVHDEPRVRYERPAELIPWADATLARSIAIAARHQVHVLVVGETGTGKELVAHEIHDRRCRDRGLPSAETPFVAINCGAIPEALAESILFGHERGAFTSARERQYGKFELARKGTLFLDEIQSLPLATQVKLLRVLQSGDLERLGSKAPVKIECQIVAASNVPLELLIERKVFRRDLYYRLNICPVYLPSLRDRKSEIPRLVELMMQKIRSEHRVVATALSPAALRLFVEHSWPGNLRELEHSLLFSCLQADGELIEPQHLPANLTGALDRFIGQGSWILV